MLRLSHFAVVLMSWTSRSLLDFPLTVSKFNAANSMFVIIY